MVFGAFNMNNKAESAPAITYTLTVEVVQVAVGGIEGEMTAFGGSSGLVSAGSTGTVATGISAGASSSVTGNGYINCGDPGFFNVTNATLSGLVINGSSFTCTISNVTGNMLFTLPVQGTTTGGRSVTLEVISEGPDGVEGTAEAFGGSATAPAGTTAEIATGVQDGESSEVFGTGAFVLGDPGNFRCTGATLANLVLLSDTEYQAEIVNVTDDVVFTVPVGTFGLEPGGEPTPEAGGGEEEPPPEEGGGDPFDPGFIGGPGMGGIV